MSANRLFRGGCLEPTVGRLVAGRLTDEAPLRRPRCGNRLVVDAKRNLSRSEPTAAEIAAGLASSAV